MKKINIAIIGCNNMGTKHLNVLREHLSDKIEISGIMNSTVESSKRKAGELGVPYFKDLGQINKNNTDAAIIATPATFHDFYAIELMKKGIICLLEKPFATSIKKCENVIEIGKKYNLPMLIGYVEVFNPATIALKKLLGNKKIKEIKSCRTTISNQRNPDITIIQNLISHDIAVLQYLTGKTVKDVIKIDADADKNRCLQSYAKINVIFSGGINAELKAEMVEANNSREMTILDEEDNKYRVDFLNRELYKNEKKIATGGNSLQEQLSHFIKCISGGKEMAVDGKTALEIEKLSLAFDDVFKKVYQNL